MATIVVDLSISREEYLSWYSGHASNVIAIARDGRKIKFPANSLQKFVTHQGIQGAFVIAFDGNKITCVEKLR